MPHHSELGGTYRQHPNNHHPHGSQAFWTAEYELWGLTREEYHTIKKRNSPKCKTCGDPQGYSWGTGDCNCEEN